MFEIGFLIIGRSAIYWITIIILANSLGLIIIYFSVFGDTAKSIMVNIFWSDLPDDSNFGMERACWVMCLSVLLVPFIVMKELAEMKAVSVTLFVACIIFVVINVLQIIIRGNDIENPDTDHSGYWVGTFDTNFILAFATISTAFNFNVNLFPIHSN